MSDGSKFVLRLNKDIWNKQLVNHGDGVSDKVTVGKKRSIETIPFSDLCSPYCKHNSLKACKICKNTASISANDPKLTSQCSFRRISIESWFFTEKVLTNVQTVISRIPEELRSAFVSCSSNETSLTALGVLSYSKLIKHIADLHVESVQKLMRPVIQKLMQHPRNVDIFNKPVDYITLQIPDYILKIPKPMDLGTVKSRLLRGEYANVEVCAADIALVFKNAMSYNPATHAVHQIALAMHEDFEAEMSIVRERCSKEAERKSTHECSLCQGSSCPLCAEKCLKFEPPVLVCHGFCGQRIKRNSIFFVSPDGCQYWCQRCQGGLPTVVSEECDEHDRVVVLFKKDLLKRKLDEEVAEPWVECDVCGRWLHQICALFNDRYNAGEGSESLGDGRFCCPICKLEQGLQPSLEHLKSLCQGFNQPGAGATSPRGVLHSPNPRGRPPKHRPVSAPTVVEPQPATSSTATQTLAVDVSGSIVNDSMSTESLSSPMSADLNTSAEDVSPLLDSGYEGKAHRKRARSLNIITEHLNDTSPSFFKRECSVERVPGPIRKLSASPMNGERADLTIANIQCNLAEYSPLPLFGTNPGVFSCLGEEAVRAGDKFLTPTPRLGLDAATPASKAEDANMAANPHWYARTLPRCRLSDFLEAVVSDRLQTMGHGAAMASLTVRVTSSSDHYIEVPEVIRDNLVTVEGRRVPLYMPYRQKCVMLFQRIDGVDVCLFTLYVQEFDERCPEPNKGRVYIAYLDSVEYFRPREARTAVYHEILVGYLKWAQARGFRQGHIWACPPQRGDSFIFWCHPAHQRTPTRERLTAWYASMLHRAARLGIVDTVGDMWSEFFCHYSRRDESLSRSAARCSLVGLGLLGKLSTSNGSKRAAKPSPRSFNNRSVSNFTSSAFSQIPPSVSGNQSGAASGTATIIDQVPVCPPVFEGDFWVNECMRVHRLVKLRSKCTDGEDRGINQRKSRDLLKHLMSKPQSCPFNQPVDPVLLNIPTYFSVVKNPMDLGTVRNNLRINKYSHMLEFVEDVRLTFNNAMLFNPTGHPINSLARDLLADFESRVRELVISRLDPDRDGGEVDLTVVNECLAGYPLGAEIVTPREKPTPDYPAHDSTVDVCNGNVESQNDCGAADARKPALERHVSFLSSEAEKVMEIDQPRRPDGASTSTESNDRCAGDPVPMAAADDDDTTHEDGGEGEGYADDQAEHGSSDGERSARRLHRGESMDSVLSISSQQEHWSSESWAQRPLLSQLGGGVSGSECPEDPLAGTPFEKPQLGIKGANSLMNELSKNVNRLKDDLFVVSFAQHQCRQPSPKAGEAADNSLLGCSVPAANNNSSDAKGADAPVPSNCPPIKGRGKGRVAALMKRYGADSREEFTERALSLLTGLSPDTSDPDSTLFVPFVDCRHTFLEMCQYRHYQFDSLRRAKHSSLLLLYHLHNPSLKQLRPHCFKCNGTITGVRWHCDQCAESCDVCSACIENGYQHPHPLIPKRVTFL